MARRAADERRTTINFLCAAIDPEWNHVEQYGKGAIYDLSPEQHGWTSYQHIKPGDIVYIIGQNRKIMAGFLVERVELATQRSQAVDGDALQLQLLYRDYVDSVIMRNKNDW